MKTIITGATRFSEHMCVHNPIRGTVNLSEIQAETWAP